MDKQLVLASGSPRRKELLSYLGVDFIIRVPEINESVQKGDLADQYVQRVASAKASAVDGDVVLGADTCVVLNGTIYGKPVDVEHAKTMLWVLAGKVHQVVTGVSVRFRDQLLVAFARTRVEFVSLDERLIDWYVDLGESSDKAGAYALQGAGSGLVKAIDGSPSHVIGLPLVETADLLTEAGMELRSSSGSNRL